MYDYLTFPYWDTSEGLWKLTAYYSNKKFPIWFDSKEAASIWRDMCDCPKWENITYCLLSYCIT